jgi:hypothetical protein
LQHLTSKLRVHRRTRLTVPSEDHSESERIAADAREREVAVKEGELEVKRAELVLRQREFQRSRWTNPLFVTVLAAFAAATANAWLQYSAAIRQANQDQSRWERTQQDETQKYLLTQVAELSTALSKMLSLIYEGISRYNRDINPSLAIPQPQPDTTDIAYWRTTAFIATTEAIERLQTTIGARDKRVGERLDVIVNDVRLLSRQVSEELIQYGAVDSSKGILLLNDAERQAAYDHWRTQWSKCRQGLGPRVADALTPPPNLSKAFGKGIDTPIAECKGDYLLSVLVRMRSKARKGNAGKEVIDHINSATNVQK